eukprot:COSAG01_NODE_728_length_14028_cov_9.273889_4_plen_33_part_00
MFHAYKADRLTQRIVAWNLLFQPRQLENTLFR